MITFICNNETVTADCPEGLPVLDWIRSQNGLTGTKEGCREGDCGACTVVLGKRGPQGVRYAAVCSCLLPMGELDGCHLVTIEGLSTGDLTPFQQSFYHEGASQCGFCTPGMIMSLTGALLGAAEITTSAALESLDGNICRCTGYMSVKRAVESVVNTIPSELNNRLEMLIENGHVPAYFRSIPERLERLPVHERSGDGKIVAGGTDIYVRSADELAESRPALISGRSDLNFISSDGHTVRIGSSVTTKQLRESQLLSDLFPILPSYLAKVSSTQIRARATIGGNIINASPIADLAIVFLALNATLFFSERSVPLHNFYTGYKQLDMRPDEVLTEISFAVPQPGSVLSCLKVSKREYLDTASVNSSMLFRVKKGRITAATVSAGGVAPFPLLLRKTGSYLTGKPLSDEVISAASALAATEISPISDVRGTMEYKTTLMKAQIRAHLTRTVVQ